MTARRFCPLIWAVCLLCRPASAEGWERLERDGLSLRFQNIDREAAWGLLDELIDGRSEVAEKLGGGRDVSVTVYVAGSQQLFDAVTRGRIPHWGVGCAFPAQRIAVLRLLPGQRGQVLKTARHELSHILLHHLSRARVPRWFDEGVAMWAAQEWRLRESTEVSYAIFSGGLVPLGEIEGVLGFSSSRARLAYTESLLAVLYLIHLGGPDAVAQIVRSLGSGVSFDVALYRVTGLTPGKFEREWAEYAKGRFSATALLTSAEALWIYMTFLLLGVFVAVRIRNRRIIDGWDEESPEDALPLRLRLKVRRPGDRS